MLAGPDWERLQVFAPGPQRPLWASTGTKTDDATPSRPGQPRFGCGPIRRRPH
jgi:hypothetical protein